VLGASKRDVLFNVSLPRALPYLFASLKIAITLAFVGTVLSETVAANKGIGNVMMIASGNFDVPMVFAGLVILAVMGVVLYMVSSWHREPHDRLGAAQERLRDGVRSMTR
jgi:NitT/TauT family transport system permease protein